ncbi:MAG: hypothetical protein JO279_18600 [Verrucomicrobia bacterium]|nr:hypothetical protein [Verrucomicrobiota bacterium]
MQKNRLWQIGARISVVMLTGGFSLLGLLSLIKDHQVCGETGISFEHVSSILGGIISFLLGGIFLLFGALHWNRLMTNN